MGTKIDRLLRREGENYILPFFWQHGEDEATLREYMKVIYDSNIRAVCVESRPHPDYCGEKWWADMDVILDEARTRGMKVWILDDSHFPTGFANGAMEKKDVSLHRQSVYCFRSDVKAGESVRFDVTAEIELPLSKIEQMMMAGGRYKKPERLFDDERVIDARAFPVNDAGEPEGESVSLAVSEDKKVVEFAPSEGNWRMFVTFLTRNAGCHRQYINMMEPESCRVLIDEVYEKHYAHYADDFGKTIAGFFSDEPELGNGGLYISQNPLGTNQDLPWSARLEEELKERLGESYAEKLYLFWENGGDAAETAKVRYIYMDAVTRLVQKSFSEQVGGWCRDHGVEYIGHVIEDNNQHARTGSSLGHYFRGLFGQDMSGIDDIGGQVLPQGEDLVVDSPMNVRDGEFYHFALGKLGVSLGAIDPKKKGRTMCEIFGNYGWEEGLRLEKYLADHFMVRGVNRYVPHAFSAKEYPDPDCPPHFYAHGHNPQYRHFGCLMNYMNRICGLIDGGVSATRVGVLYHGEAEWTGEFMLMQKPARVLAENQIDYHFLPADIFTEPENYACSLENGLRVNGYDYRLLLIPHAQFIGKGLAGAIERLQRSGACKPVFVGGLPQGYYDSDDALSDAVKHVQVVELAELACFLGGLCDEREGALKDASIQPQNPNIRILHYTGDEDVYYIVNEGSDIYEGTLHFAGGADWYEYDAWNNLCYEISAESADGWNQTKVHLYPGEGCILAAGKREEYAKRVAGIAAGLDGENSGSTGLALDGKWRRSLASATAYPVFSNEREIGEFRNVGEEYPEFSGFVRYDNSLTLEEVPGRVQLEITDAFEGVEAFVNGESLGIQILPPFLYDVTKALKAGENQIRIEVATTLERERSQDRKYGLMPPKKYEDCAPTGIVGTVRIYRV